MKKLYLKKKYKVFILLIALTVVVSTSITVFSLINEDKSISAEETIKGDIEKPANTNFTISSRKELEEEKEDNPDYNGKAYYYSQLEKLIVELTDMTS